MVCVKQTERERKREKEQQHKLDSNKSVGDNFSLCTLWADMFSRSHNNFHGKVLAQGSFVCKECRRKRQFYGFRYG